MGRTNLHRNHHRVLWGITSGIIAIAAIYGIGVYHYSNSQKFIPNTVIAGVDVGGKDQATATKLVEQSVKSQTITLKDGAKKISNIKVADTGLSVNAKAFVSNSLQKQNGLTWPLQMVNVAHADKVSDGDLTIKDSDTQKFDSFSKKELKELNSDRTASKASKITLTSTGAVKLSGGSQGNYIDAHGFKKNLKATVASGKSSMDLKDSYQTPTETKANQITDQYKKIQAEDAVYDINGTKVTIPSAEIVSWLKVDTNVYGVRSLSLDDTKVSNYLNGLNDKYSTYKKSFNFKSTKQGTITVKDGNFGWEISTDVDKTTLENKILAGKSFDMQATISGSGQGLKPGEVGNTYVEVDKAAQHMWFYHNGKLELSTSVVTGLPPNQTTPTGVWFVWKKQQNAVLKGKNDNGTSYASPVKYWMPIDYTGVGLHDAPWQPTFGGDWFKTHGSHGCVNTPPSVMPKLYADVPTGTPVVVH
ncbi:L,D-transpeptidase family protein [Pediococcus claussenii]|uniref:L,D-transpeptidase catalytic domain protein n=1 Tax=Pediococcus claussenii (strain ATCC BAA-344 / DSM 14800 / JCM 18046 / KCTC 3811 / LMG 21948 / P06) TaxID=701521 RepID=G8PAB8_PEDCP|nr:L,D-transpeptidase family protein [Pediococcus claussenii]AEV94557.1 L,D-transpeptidase catalytic domain protein [Pediococcus claussenii ATCC BAA-344]ANZ69772.1 hypothetical protein AYR57_05320 [Pediococcus claussenii]ANZ71589.1 hypothetical protein AYR58_05325 [Pediococcus claussenii]KRN19737.1 hypothetical protein IV79_GL001024 [Pediococcus claussenii]